MPKNSLVGFIKFEEGIKCKAEALSETFEIELAGENGRIFFPSLPDIDLNTEDLPFGGFKLAQPKQWLQPINLRDVHEWGRVRSCPDGNSVVNIAIVEFGNVDTDRENLGREFQDSFNKFIRDFKRCIHLVCPAYNAIEVEGGDIYGLELKVGTLTSKDRLNKTTYGGTITIDVSGNNYMSRFQISELFLLASNSQRIKLEYNLLVDACIAFADSDYRKTIIEIASAIEVSLNNKIKKYFDENHILFGDKLFKKYRMLGGLIDLCDVLSIEIPKDKIVKIKDERNKILHKGEFPLEKIAKEKLNDAREVVKELSPNLFD